MKLTKILISLSAVNILSTVPIVQSCGITITPRVSFLESNEPFKSNYDIALFGNPRDEKNIIEFITDYYDYVSNIHTVITSPDQLPDKQFYNATLIKNINFNEITNVITFDADRYESDKKKKWEITETAKNVYVPLIYITNTFMVNQFMNEYTIYLDAKILAKSEAEIREYILNDFNQKFYDNFGVLPFINEKFSEESLVVLNEENKDVAYAEEWRNEPGNYLLYYFGYYGQNEIPGINNKISTFENEKFLKFKISEIKNISELVEIFKFEFYKNETTLNELQNLEKGDLKKISLVFDLHLKTLHYDIPYGLTGIIYKDDPIDKNIISSDEQLQTAIENQNKIFLKFFTRGWYPYDHDLIVELQFI